MKSIFMAAGLGLMLMACENTGDNTAAKPATTASATTAQTFGEKITEEGAIPVEQLGAMLNDTNSVAIKLTGTVSAACQTKGCWMTLKNPGGEELRVTFKDYAFFVPKDCAGKTAFVDGVARIETTSVADLKEFAKDDKKSKAEIDAITEPLNEVVFEAKGVILK
jgi:hypothetical protein